MSTATGRARRQLVETRPSWLGLTATLPARSCILNCTTEYRVHRSKTVLLLYMMQSAARTDCHLANLVVYSQHN